MRRVAWLGALCGALLAATHLPAAAAVLVQIDGIDDPAVQRQLTTYLGTPEEENLDGFLRDLRQNALRALQAVGYYRSEVSFRRSPGEGGTRVRIDVDLGKPVRIENLNLELDGEARNDPAYASLLAAPGIAAGDRLDHGRYESLKQRLLDLAERRGYFDARFSDSQVKVNVADGTAAVDLRLDSGARYRFGRITLDPAPIDEAILRRWLPLASGMPYHADLVTAATNKLRDTGYFTAVRLQLARDRALAGEVPLHVQLQATPSNIVSFGVGFATDTGPRARTTWEKPHLNQNGHSIRSEIAVSQVRRSLGTSYRVPDVEAPARRYYQFEAALRSEEVQDTESDNRTAAVREVFDTDSGWRQDLFLRWLDEDFKVGSDRSTVTMYIPGVGYTLYAREGGVFARQGARYGIRLESASRGLASDLDLQKLVVNGKWLLPVAGRHYLVGRAELGALATDDFDRLPGSERFFTGGDQSVRGFDYQSISPEDDEGALIGGHYLNVASAEFVWQYTDSWGLALFTDAGRAYSDGGEPVRVGAGFGLRWQSPIGTLRADIGFAVSEDGTPARLHLTIGPEL